MAKVSFKKMSLYMPKQSLGTIMYPLIQPIFNNFDQSKVIGYGTIVRTSIEYQVEGEIDPVAKEMLDSGLYVIGCHIENVGHTSTIKSLSVILKNKNTTLNIIVKHYENRI